jgi:hypothetical protein
MRQEIERIDGFGRRPARPWTAFAIGVAAGLVFGGVLVYATDSWIWGGIAAGSVLFVALAGLLGAAGRPGPDVTLPYAQRDSELLSSVGEGGGGSAPDASGNPTAN